MNNVCKRNCYWNYDNQCVCECDDHCKDGTVFTKTCSQFLVSQFEGKIEQMIEHIGVMVYQLPYDQLKKAKGEVFRVWREYHKKEADNNGDTK